MLLSSSLDTTTCSDLRSIQEFGDVAAHSPISPRSASRFAAASGAVASFVPEAVPSPQALQTQCDDQRRRLMFLEQKVEVRMESRLLSLLEDRERWPEMQGKVDGLIGELRCLSERVESIDRRLWTRTHGSELPKQKTTQDLFRQAHLMENQGRLAAWADDQRRQLGDHGRGMEDLELRLKSLEEQRAPRSDPAGMLEARLKMAENKLDNLSAEFHKVDAGLREVKEAADRSGSPRAHPADLDEVLQASQGAVHLLDRRFNAKLGEVAVTVANLRVRLDGQIQRIGSRVDCLEGGGPRNVQALWNELTQLRQRLQDDDHSAASLLVSSPQLPRCCEDGAHSDGDQIAAHVVASGTIDENEEDHDLMDLNGGLTDLGGHLTKQVEGMTLDVLNLRVDDAIRFTEKGLARLDERYGGQLEEIITAFGGLQGKLSGQVQEMCRQLSRFEHDQESHLRTLRGDLAHVREQARHQLEIEVASLFKRVQDSHDALYAQVEDYRDRCREGR